MRQSMLALRLLAREWRSGTLATLFLALLIAVTAVFTISLVTDRLISAMGKESAELIGGDLVISSTREPNPAWQPLAKERGLRTAQIHRFDSVFFHGDAMLLASVKAVSETYPLLGKLEVADTPEGISYPMDGIPSPGSAWVDARVLERLQANVGDEIHFGATTLRITKILTFEPDQGNGLFQFAPRILVNEADLKPAQVLGPGSRIHYFTLFAGDGINGFKAAIEPPGAGHSLLEPGKGNNRGSDALLKATQYIRIATLLTIILATIAIALTARRYSEQHYDVSAMMRCLGASRKSVLTLYCYQLSYITLLALLVAGVAGWLAHEVILLTLQPLLPLDLPLPGPAPWLAAAGTAVLLITGFALPPVLRLSDMPPLRVLRKDLASPPLSVWLVYGAAAISQGLLLLLLFDDLGEVLFVLLAAAAALLGIGSATYLTLKKLKTLLTGRGLLSRSLRNLANHAATTTAQIMAFAITLMLVIVVTQLRTGLLEEWRLQLPDNAPNYFAFNIFPDQVEAFSAIVKEKAELNPLYPIVRGRVVAINGDRKQAENNDNWERTLTWMTQLPADNKIIAGHWPPKDGEVSVEAEHAKELSLTIGDTLTLNVAGELFQSRVTSIRSVVWESLSPNFYLVFSQQQLSEMPITYLTSFYLPQGNTGPLRTLTSEFPALSLVDVNALLERMDLILKQVSLTVELVMVFVLLAGFAVLFSTLESTGEERIQEGALMRAVGAARGYLRKAYLMEFGLIGLFAGIIAAMGAEIATAVIYIRLFELDFKPTVTLWLLTPIVSAVMVALAGYLGGRKILSVSPVLLLNRG